MVTESRPKGTGSFGASGRPWARNVLKWYQNCSFGASGRHRVRNGRKIVPKLAIWSIWVALCRKCSKMAPKLLIWGIWTALGPKWEKNCSPSLFKQPFRGVWPFNQPFRGVWFLQPTLPRGLVPSTNPSEGMGPTSEGERSRPLQPTLPRGWAHFQNGQKWVPKCIRPGAPQSFSPFNQPFRGGWPLQPTLPRGWWPESATPPAEGVGGGKAPPKSLLYVF